MMPSLGWSLAGLAAFACAGPTAHALRSWQLQAAQTEAASAFPVTALMCIPEQPVKTSFGKERQGRWCAALPPRLGCKSSSNTSLFSLPPGLRCPLSAMALEKAATPLGHQGGWLRVRRALQKLSGTGRLSVAILGTSMTVGHEAKFGWPSRLEELFGDAGLRVNVSNFGVGGSTSDLIIARWVDLEPELKRADLIIVDYVIGDALLNDGYNEAVKLLLHLPQRPGVIDLLTIAPTRPVLGPADLPTDDCSQVHLGKFSHVPVNRALNVPMISYTEAVCTTGRTLWMTQGAFAERPGVKHPGSPTHDLVARIVYSVLRREMGRACLGDLGWDVLPATGSASTACLAQHPTASQTALRGTLRPWRADPEWRLYEDVPGKPGWIVDEHSSGKKITFNVTTKVGWIQVEYLGTYQNIGSASVYIDGSPIETASSGKRTCELHGLWQRRASLSKFTKMKTGLGAGFHTLTFVGQGKKFKLLGIVAC